MRDRCARSPLPPLAATPVTCSPVPLASSATCCRWRKSAPASPAHSPISATAKDHAHQFAAAILTTDLKRKAAAVRFKIGKEQRHTRRRVQRVGHDRAADGSGNGAAARDHVGVPHDGREDRREAGCRSNSTSRPMPASNAVTVDDHTSTNDTAAILASGLGPAIDSAKSLAAFAGALDEVCQSLAYQIAADGEGATKVVKITVSGAASLADARAIARAHRQQPAGEVRHATATTPNWGRIVSAAGLCGAAFDPDRSALKLQGTAVFRHGTPLKFNADAVSKALQAPEVIVDLTCGLGKHAATVWTCDLSKEYVTINADYHT